MTLYHRCKRSNCLPSHLPVYDFLAPSLLQLPRASRQTRCLSTTSRRSITANSNDAQFPYAERSRTPKSGPKAASNPAPLNKPLTQAQRDFLNSAVRPLQNPNPYFSPLTSPTAPSQPSWRTSSHPNLQSPNTYHRLRKPPPPPPNETHVRPRSRTLQDLQFPPREAQSTTYSHVPHLDSRGLGSRLGDCNNGP